MFVMKYVCVLHAHVQPLFPLQHVPRDSSLPSDAMLDDTPVGGPRGSRLAK
jgi:hypothetical protein